MKKWSREWPIFKKMDDAGRDDFLNFVNTLTQEEIEEYDEFLTYYYTQK